MKSSPSSQPCPDYEKLSAFADDPVDPSVAAHLEECPVCRRKVDAYIQIQHLLQADAEPARDLTGDILDAVRKTPLSSPPRSFTWLRYAAAIAVTAILTVFITSSSDSRKPASSMTARAADAVPAETPSADEAASNTSQAVSSVQDVPRSVATGPLQTVSTDSEANTGGSGSRSYLPGSHVMHVWSAPDINSVRRIFAGLLPGQTPDWHQTDGILSARLTLSDRVLQSLVDRLYQSGWELFSPLYPQPGAGSQTILTGRKIDYQIKVLPRQ